MNIVNKQKVSKDQSKVYEAFNKNQLTAAEATNTKNRFYNDISTLPEVILETITYSSRLPNRDTVPKIKFTTSDTHSSETPYDGRLGSDESRVVCDTCFQVCNNCTGHMGIIELPFSLIQPYFRDYLIRVLRCICMNCKSFILTQDAMVSEGIGSNLKGFARLNKIAAISDKRSCPNGHKNVIFKQTEAACNKTPKVKFYFRTQDKSEKIEFYSVSKIKSILQEADKINGGFKLLGFENETSPIDFIDDYISIISKSSRPRTYKDNVAKDDFLTYAYNQIIAKLNSPGTNQKEEVLYIWSHLMNNVGLEYKQPNESKEPMISIKDRMTGKDKLIRKFMLSTRTNFSGRTVAGCKKELKFGEMSPPPELASEIRKTEIVTKYNIERIRRQVMEGKVVCFKPDIKKDYWKTVNEKYLETIDPGNVVQRWTCDGDIIIANRQPTLHRASMIPCVVKFIGKSKLGGVHLSNTSGLNMDYDGDEVNMHVLQTSGAEIEARTFASVASSVSSYTFPGIIPALTYNSLAGIYLLSTKNITEQEYKIILMELNDYPEHKMKVKNLVKDGHPYSKALISAIFPNDYSLIKDDIIIKNGVFYEGTLKKKNMGNDLSSILVSIKKWYDKVVYSNFISISNFIANRYLQLYGLTISIKDIELVTPGPDGEEDWKDWRNKVLDETNQEVLDMPILNNPSEFEKTQRENDIIIYTIAPVSDKIMNFVAEKLSKDNPLKIMTTSGAKGKTENIMTIMSHVGSQLLGDGNRPEKTLSRNRRWRHTFPIDDRSIYSRGFIRSSYFKGLNQDEFWSNAQASRITLMDTAIKTADIGAIERRMVKAMEDLCGDYDGTVRNSRGAIFQYSYGLGFSADNMLLDKRKKIFFIDLDEALTKVNEEFGN